MNTLTLSQKLRAHNKLWQNVLRRGDCWIYTGRILNSGYGGLNLGPTVTTAHRLAYMVTKGDIPDGFDIHHTCHDPLKCAGGKACPHRPCITPAHLEPETRHENIMLGAGPGTTRKRRAAVSHCPYGHPYDSRNTYIHVTSHTRICRACTRMRMHLHRNKKKRAS